MKSKKGILGTILVLLLAAAVSLSAGGGEKKDHLAYLQKELSLSDAQVTQLKQKFDAIHSQGEEAELKARALRGEIEDQEKSANPNRQIIEQRKASLEALHKEWKAKVTDIYRSVLTSEQFAKWQKMESDERHDKEKKEYREKKKNKD